MHPLGYDGLVDVSTYLFFDGRCQDAIELYVSALGAEVVHLSRFDAAPKSLRPPNGERMVFHATLRIGETLIHLSDDPSRERGKFGGFALLVHLDSEQSVDRISQALAVGGSIDLEPMETTWARRYAIVIDTFDIVWKLQFS